MHANEPQEPTSNPPRTMRGIAPVNVIFYAARSLRKVYK
jgi:hypothetical protein